MKRTFNRESPVAPTREQSSRTPGTRLCEVVPFFTGDVTPTGPPPVPAIEVDDG